MCYFSNTEEEEDTCGLQVDWLSGKLCRKRLLLIRILESGVVCWVYQDIGKRHTQDKTGILKCTYISSRVSKILFGEKDGEGYWVSVLARKQFLNVQFERDIKVWLNYR